MSGEPEPAPELSTDDLRAISDALVRHQVYLSRFSTGVLARIRRLLGEADAELIDKLSKRLGNLSGRDLREVTMPTWTTQRLKLVLGDLRAASAAVQSILDGELKSSMPDLIVYEQQFILDTFRRVAVELQTASTTASQLYAAATARPFLGRHLRDEVKDVGTRTQRNMQRIIRTGFVNGDTIQEMTARMQSAEGFEKTQADAERVVRTATTHVAAFAREQMFEENADLIKGVRWVSTLDGRTSAQCRALDGMIFPVGKGPRPPAHPNCRSTVVPVTRDLAELIPGFVMPTGARPSTHALPGMTPKEKRAAHRAAEIVGGGETYNTWLKRQSPEFIREVLGPSRMALYLKGDLPMERFVDFNSMRPYTLAQLREREPKAFARAGL